MPCIEIKAHEDYRPIDTSKFALEVSKRVPIEFDRVIVLIDYYGHQSFKTDESKYPVVKISISETNEMTFIQKLAKTVGSVLEEQLDLSSGSVPIILDLIKKDCLLVNNQFK